MTSGTFGLFRFLANKRYRRHALLLRSLSGAMVLVLFMIAIAVAADGEATKLERPVSVKANLLDGQALRGQIESVTADGFVITDPNGEVHPIAWRDLQTSSLYELYPQVHDTRTAATWLALGRLLLAREHGERFATIALNRAKVLGDDEVKEQVAAVLADYQAKKEAEAKAAEEARRREDGRFFSSERIKPEQPPRVRFTPIDGEQQQGWVWSYDREGFELGDTFVRPAAEPKAEEDAQPVLQNTFAWQDLPPDEAWGILSQLLRDRPAESWFNAGSALLHQGADDQAERAFAVARRTDRGIADRVDALKQQVERQRAELAARRRKHNDAQQKIALTYERAKLWEPLPIEIGLGEDIEPITGDLVAFDGTNLYLAAKAGEDSQQAVPWTSLPGKSASGLLDQLIDERNAGGWFRAGRLLLTLPGGEEPAKDALIRAYNLDRKLKEPIQVVWRDHRQRLMEMAKADGATPGRANGDGGKANASGPEADGEPARVAIGAGTLREGDARENAAEGDVAFITDFDCGLQHPVKRLGPSHFVIDLPGGRQQNGFFLFKLDGVAGKTVQIDFRNAPLRKWGTLNPVFTYADDLSDPANFQATRSTKTRLSAQGIPIPVAEDAGDSEDAASGGRGWHYLSTVWKEGNNLALIHRFPADAGKSVYIAMKYPYTPQLCDVYMSRLEEREKKAREAGRDPGFKVYRVGQSKGGRTLWLAAISNNLDSKEAKDRPCILLYAREHGDEHDSTWPVQGAAEFLLANTDEARRLRNQFVFLIAPMVDPDGAAKNVYENMIHTFREGEESIESKAWAGFFHQWMLDGYRLDLVLNLHNVESGEGPHVFPAQFEPDDDRAKAARLYNAHLADQLKPFGYSFRTGTGNEGISRFRLGGHLHRYYAALHQPYEVNSQASERHLDLYDLKVIGPLMVRSAAQYFTDRNSYDIQRETLAHRTVWKQRIDRYAGFFDHKTIFGLERWCLVMPQFEQDWIKTCYPRRYGKLASDTTNRDQIIHNMER